MKKRHVIIVGGGASGMVAAISAAREGAKVTIIEHQNKLGKKILSTGNGKCNLTNEYMVAECFRGEDLSIVDTVLKKFGYKETVSFFESLGVLTKSRQGISTLFQNSIRSVGCPCDGIGKTFSRCYSK